MDPSSSKPSPPAGVSPVPAPWRLKAKLYLFTKLLSPGNREDPVLQGLPPGSYSPTETVHSSALGPVNGAPQWKGGLYYIVLVRYEDSPVGPYDELIAVSDGWANPHEKKRTSGRITNIYVSTLQSVWNGRNNWSMYHFHFFFFSFALVLGDLQRPLTSLARQISRSTSHDSNLFPRVLGRPLSRCSCRTRRDRFSPRRSRTRTSQACPSRPSF